MVFIYILVLERPLRVDSLLHFLEKSKNILISLKQKIIESKMRPASIRKGSTMQQSF